MKRSIFSALFIVVCLGACTRKLHQWQTPGNEFEMEISASTWDYLEFGQFVPVHENSIEDAVALLTDKTLVLLTSEQQAAMAMHGPRNEGLQPFLIRGVAYYPPDAVAVLLSPDTKLLLVSQWSYDGEGIGALLLAGEAPHPSPFVVYLETAPAYVFATADFAGDVLFRDGSRYSWTELKSGWPANWRQRTTDE